MLYLTISNIVGMFQESLPPDYARIFAFDNFTRTQKLVLARAQDLEQNNVTECVAVGSYARLHIRDVPISAANKLCMLVKTMPVISCGLLQHESKISVLHFRSVLLNYIFITLFSCLCLSMM